MPTGCREVSHEPLSFLVADPHDSKKEAHDENEKAEDDTIETIDGYVDDVEGGELFKVGKKPSSESRTKR